VTVQIDVRPYRLPEDFEALVRIYEESEDHHASIDPLPPLVQRDVEQTRRRFARTQLDPERALLVAEVDGEVVGLIEASMRRDTDAGFVGAYVDQVSVAAAWRGRGVGTRLMDEVERWAIDKGAMNIALDTHTFNTGARRLYERLGFVTRAVIMSKRLPPRDAS
jgi:ribosomal protein S18 acetylase RimI-like enzyme